MKKKLLLLFIAACMLVCLVPFAGMAVSVSDKPVGNENKAELPSISKDDGSFNELYFQQFGNYFEKSFAFRPQIISADAEIQANLFKTSNLDSVVTGNDGWLYYSSSLDDYLGRNLLSDRSINNIAYNLKITQDYVEQNGAKFLFTVAPNKNSLYPEHMPYYYSAKVSEDKNIYYLKSALENSQINYCDLFELFKNQDETLYLKQDSHWNNKGALLAYNNILDSLGKAHDDYASAQVKKEKTFYGDLAQMIYPATQKPEYNYYYDINSSYVYTTKTESVEEAIIKTGNDKADGSLYMYRDSFGNALLPFFANAYGSAEFTKAFPVNVAIDMLVQKPDTVIFEIVERNLSWFASSPPVLPSPEVSVDNAIEADADVNIAVSEVNMTLLELSGSVDSQCDENTEIYVTAKDKNGNTRTFQAFRVTDESTDCAFKAYVSAEEFDEKDIIASVMIK